MQIMKYASVLASLATVSSTSIIPSAASNLNPTFAFTYTVSWIFHLVYLLNAHFPPSSFVFALLFFVVRMPPQIGRPKWTTQILMPCTSMPVTLNFTAKVRRQRPVAAGRLHRTPRASLARLHLCTTPKWHKKLPPHSKQAVKRCTSILMAASPQKTNLLSPTFPSFPMLKQKRLQRRSRIMCAEIPMWMGWGGTFADRQSIAVCLALFLIMMLTLFCLFFISLRDVEPFDNNQIPFFAALDAKITACKKQWGVFAFG